MNQGLSLCNIAARTGHATGTNVDEYVDPTNPVRSFPAANALHGNQNLKAKPVLPELSAVGMHNRSQWIALIDAAFLVSVPSSKAEGEHFVILELIMASMIRHYENILRECGEGSRFVSDLQKAAKNINLTDAAHPSLPPKLVLLEWSKAIQSDLKMRMLQEDVETTDPDGTKDHSLIAHMAKDLADLKQSNNEVVIEVAAQKATIIDQDKIMV